ncbi:UvrABC system protein C [Campylobacterota bacterium]|nr:UvrABC system protein C [Campylobacterota bacterium]
MTLLETIKQLPTECGVYQYFDSSGRLLYVGKAKNLKNRVKSYFSFTPALAPDPRLNDRIQKMISEAVSLAYIVVENESDALILENSLIKQLKPKYNILLRDDKTYPYIYIDLSQEYPRFEITRKVISGKSVKYFGPFASGARDILNALYQLFKFVQKRNCIKEHKRCLFYQINRCAAPCEALITSDEYMAMINDAFKLINHKEHLAKLLTVKMEKYAENEHYEEAAQMRDQIRNVISSTIQSGVDMARNENFDVIALADLGINAVAVRLFIREGKVISSSHQSFRFTDKFDFDEAYKRAFLGFYKQDIPITATTIYIEKSFSELEDISAWLIKRFNKKFEIIVPKTGAKKTIVELARKNAEEHIRNLSQHTDITIAIQELFGLENPPKRIEAFDNSHLMQEGCVGAMIVYDNDSFIKSDYRHYNLDAKNEYDQMKEILIKRAEKFGENPPPDCFLIDGGETLRKLAQDILASVGVHIDILAISKEKLDSKAHRAKGAARDIIYANGEIYRLPPTDRRLQLLQKLRDESHRFAIAFHRKQKQKTDAQFDILKHKGIGTATMKRLIDVFGTFEAINNASFDEIRSAAGLKAANALKGNSESN